MITEVAIFTALPGQEEALGQGISHINGLFAGTLEVFHYQAYEKE